MKHSLSKSPRLAKLKDDGVMANRSILLGLAATASLTLAATAAGAACPGDSQVEMNACAEATHQAAEAKLTAAYAKFRPIPAALRTAERAWLAYRDAECAFEHTASPDGSMYLMEQALCLAAMDDARVKELESDLKSGYGP
jgi:uncharacterized protein YecT (DUF1311 family)